MLAGRPDAVCASRRQEGVRYRNFLLVLCTLVGSLGIGVAAAPPALAHQSGCHRWHSCPSDSGCYDLNQSNYDTCSISSSDGGSNYGVWVLLGAAGLAWWGLAALGVKREARREARRRSEADANRPTTEWAQNTMRSCLDGGLSRDDSLMKVRQALSDSGRSPEDIASVLRHAGISNVA